ncbi:hypothetical protein ASPCAL08357 [Aspergillus calidoustus]|uniref:Uncharacterized protein n=1 Tax=Aspergillus calidoustus TaxID=454130 RepID=A0A0U5GT35_ASPCI|nr:hypothetical protein ASPCAL08357 [Aspergillus calidoustus]
MVFPHSSSQVSWPGESDEDTARRGDGNEKEDKCVEPWRDSASDAEPTPIRPRRLQIRGRGETGIIRDHCIGSL